jgi:hypothetical protein
MVQTVRLIDNRIIPYEKFRGMSGGKIGIFKRDDLVKLDLAETRDVSTIKLPI